MGNPTYIYADLIQAVKFHIESKNETKLSVNKLVRNFNNPAIYIPIKDIFALKESLR